MQKKNQLHISDSNSIIFKDLKSIIQSITYPLQLIFELKSL